MITLNKNIKKKQTYVTWILTALLFIFSKDIANNVEKWFGTSNYDENDKWPLPIGKNKKLIGCFKDELGGKIMKEFVGLRAKTYTYLMNNDSEHKKAKEQRNV